MKTVTMYTTTHCAYCKRAKELLALYTVTPDEILVDRDVEKLQEMVTKTGKMSVPQIYIGDHHIGGFSELKQLHEDGALTELLS